MSKHLQRLMKSLARAEDRALIELRKQFPVGTKLRVQIQKNHITPSDVEVLNHIGGRHGALRVRMLRGRYGPGFVTTITLDRIIERLPMVMARAQFEEQVSVVAA